MLPGKGKSDGTAAGTVLVKDINPGSNYGGNYIFLPFSSFPENLTAVGNTLFFTANDNVNGRELWKSDGTAAGTVLVKDIRPGSYAYGSYSYSSSPDNLTAVGNTLFFTAFDDVNGRELWKSNGTAAGTVLVRDIRAGSFGSFGSYPSNLTALGNTLFFTAFDGVNGGLWKSDGTAAGTVLVKNISLDNLTVVGNTLTLFFTAVDSVNGLELWKSDGTAAGTVLVRDIRAGSSGSNLENLTAVGSTLFFTADDGVNGKELWKSDGTAAGTVLVKDIRPGSSNSNPSNLTAAGNTLFFTAFDDVNGTELWRSDGTAAGTVLVGDIRPGSSGSYPQNLRVVGNTLFFTANNGVNGEELWAVSTLPVPTLAIAATNASQTEGNSGSKAFTFTVTRSVITTGTNNVSWAVTGTGTNPANATDFVGSVLPSGTVSFAAGETSKVITVNVQGDTTVEPDENFTVTLSNATNGATITTATATGTIENDDLAVPTLAIAATSANQTEGNSGSKAFTFTVTRAVNTTGTNNVNWAVTGSGTNPANATDFVGGVLPSGTVSFAAGETSKVITVNVLGDTTVELNENFTVTLSNATNGATITTATATGTIENDDAAVPTLTIAATSSSQTEGNSGSKAFTFTVTRAVNTTGSNNVNWAVTGTGTNPANATDFVGGLLPSGTVSFAAGETSKVITVNVLGDATVELNENFTVTLSNATNGATITTATATGTIENDDISVTPIEAFGNTKLVQDATNKLYAQIGNNNPIAIKNGATHIATNTYPGWQILAAETVNGINQVLLRNTSQNLLYIWNLDSNWNWQSSQGGWGLNSTQAFSQETNFQQDFNGDEIIGQPTTFPSITLAVSPSSVTEDGTTNLVYTFTRTGSTTSALTANYTVGGTAT
ncbi:ELWxxDGT repeat protein, partial [Microcystis aeruginosa]|uniref:ELWxxDGT repeat protein n=1 Tax=Microcystis aeruginosa TaxID=1126 RepID=UPI0026497F65